MPTNFGDLTIDLMSNLFVKIEPQPRRIGITKNKSDGFWCIHLEWDNDMEYRRYVSDMEFTYTYSWEAFVENLVDAIEYEYKLAEVGEY